MSDPTTIITYAPQPQTVITNAGPVGPAGGDFALDSPEFAAAVLAIAGGSSSQAPLVGVLGGGDSIMNGAFETPPLWGNRIATTLGLNWVKCAMAGQSTSDIALRLGALDVRLSAAAVLPADTTPVAVTISTTGAWYVLPFSFDCVLEDGTAVTLTHDGSHDASIGQNPVWTVARKVAAATTKQLANNAKIHCTEADAYLTNYLWLVDGGMNNFGPQAGDTTGAFMIRDFGLIAQRLLAAGNDRFLFFAPHNRPGEPSDRQAVKTATNQVMALKYSTRWIDVMTVFATWALAYEGITPTLDDQSKMALNQAPNSLIADGTHPNDYGYDVMIALALQAIAALNYVLSAVPTTTDALAKPLAAPTIGAATSSTLPVTVPATAFAHGVTVQFQPTGATAWTDGPNALPGATVTLSTLQQGTGYNVRYRPVNVLGPGTPSLTVATATTGAAPVTIASDGFTTTSANINGRVLDGTLGTDGTSRSWVANNAFMSVAANAMTEPDVAGRQTTTYVDVGVSDARVEFQMRRPQVGLTHAAYTRLSAVGNGFYGYVVLDNGAVRCVKHDGTNLTIMQTLPAGSLSDDEYWAAGVVGTVFTVWRNGVAVYSVNDTTSTPPAGGTKVAINLSRAGTARKAKVTNR